MKHFNQLRIRDYELRGTSCVCMRSAAGRDAMHRVSTHTSKCRGGFETRPYGDVRRMGAGEPRPYGGKHATMFGAGRGGVCPPPTFARPLNAHSVRNASLGRKCHRTKPCIPSGMHPVATLHRLRNRMHSYGMQVAVARHHIIFTERFIPNGMSTKNQTFLPYILNF